MIVTNVGACIPAATFPPLGGNRGDDTVNRRVIVAYRVGPWRWRGRPGASHSDVACRSSSSWRALAIRGLFGRARAPALQPSAPGPLQPLLQVAFVFRRLFSRRINGRKAFVAATSQLQSPLLISVGSSLSAAVSLASANCCRPRAERRWLPVLLLQSAISCPRTTLSRCSLQAGDPAEIERPRGPPPPPGAEQRQWPAPRRKVTAHDRGGLRDRLAEPKRRRIHAPRRPRAARRRPTTENDFCGGLPCEPARGVIASVSLDGRSRSRLPA